MAYVEGRSSLDAWLLPEDHVVAWTFRNLPILSRGLLGTLFLLVAVLTIERWVRGGGRGGGVFPAKSLKKFILFNITF